MSKLWIKICGITCNSDATAAADFGADAIGLVFYSPSPRAVVAENVAEIVAGVSGRIEIVALFVDPSEAEVRNVLATNAVSLLQFHGQESEAFCKSFAMPYLKAVAVKDDGSIARIIDDYPSAEMLLLDSYNKKAPGGTGTAFDWEIGESISEASSKKIVVAGGLNPENVQTAIRQIQPYGVDVSSGVEKSYGIKDLSKLKIFIEGARSV